MNRNEIATHISAAGISQSLARAEIEKANALYDEFAQHFWPIIGSSNQMAYIAMDEAVDALKEAGLFRQQVKQSAQRALAEYEKYEKLCTRHFKDYDDDRYYLWQDLIGRAAGKLEPDIQKLYFAIKSKIDRYKVRNAVALAKVQTAMALVSLANLLFDEMAAKFQRQTPVRIADNFKAGRITACESHWRLVGYFTGRTDLADVDLRNDPQCQLAVQVILTRYQAADFLNDAAKEALELNPDVERKYCKQ